MVYVEDSEDPEVRNAVVCAEDQGDVVLEFMQYFSSWTHLKKAVAWMLKLRALC